MALDASDPALDLLKEYVDRSISDQIYQSFEKLHSSLQEEIKDAFSRTKEYVKMQADRLQREAQAQIDAAMKLMWENVESEMQTLKSTKDDNYNFDEECDNSYDDGIAGNEEDDKLTTLGDVETKMFGKSFNQRAEPHKAEQSVSDLEDSPTKKPKTARQRNKGPGAAAKAAAKRSSAGRPPGSKNKVDQKDVIQKLKDELKAKNEELASLTKP